METEKKRVAWTNIKTPEGFVWSYTIRETDEIITKMNAFMEKCKEMGWTPEAIKNGFTKEQPKTAGLCPVHNVEMKWGTSKKTGKSYKFHKLEDDTMCFGHI